MKTGGWKRSPKMGGFRLKWEGWNLWEENKSINDNNSNKYFISPVCVLFYNIMKERVEIGS